MRNTCLTVFAVFNNNYLVNFPFDGKAKGKKYMCDRTVAIYLALKRVKKNPSILKRIRSNVVHSPTKCNFGWKFPIKYGLWEQLFYSSGLRPDSLYLRHLGSATSSKSSYSAIMASETSYSAGIVPEAIYSKLEGSEATYSTEMASGVKYSTEVTFESRYSG